MFIGDDSIESISEIPLFERFGIEAYGIQGAYFFLQRRSPKESFPIFFGDLRPLIFCFLPMPSGS